MTAAAGAGTSESSRLPQIRFPDLVAGMSVALVLVPQSLAYAQLAGMPPVVGLYAAAFPPLIAAVVASSRYLQTGPTALTALLTFAAISSIATPGSDEWIAAAATLAIVVGVARVVIGLVRGGAIVYLLSEPMLAGFTRGAALLILASQVPAVLGVNVESTGTLADGWSALSEPSAWVGGAALTAVCCAAIVVGCRYLHPLVPGILIAAIASVVAVSLGATAGPVVGAIPSGLPGIALPDGGYGSLLLPGLVIALIGFSESAAIARTYAVLDRTPWNPNRDFIGQGLGNVVSGLVGGMPVGGSFTRSALNRMAGAKSAMSGAVAALAVIAFLPFSGLLSDLPRAALGAFVMLAAATLIRPREIAQLWRLSRVQFAVAVATFALTIGLAPHIERAVVLGVVLTIVVHLWRETVTSTKLTLADGGGVLDVRPSGVLWFANAHAAADAVARTVSSHQDVRRVRLRLDGLGRVDLTAALSITRLVEDLAASGVAVEIVDLPPIARPVLERVLAEGAVSETTVSESLAARGAP